MPSAEDPPSSPVGKFSTTEDALTYYKSQYEQLEAELTEFQASSRELESELEKEVEASDKRESKLREKVESLKYEVDEWKVSVTLSMSSQSSVFAMSICEHVKSSIVSIGLMLTSVSRRSTSKPRQKRTQCRTRSKKKLQPSATPTGPSSSSSGISRSQTMTLKGRPGIQHPRWKISSPSITSQ